MKIIYSADSRVGAAYQLLDFLAATTHQVKVAGYPTLTHFFGTNFNVIDWNLEAINASPPRIRSKKAELLTKDIIRYNPDLVIIDNEPIIARLANQLGIPIVYCTPLHLLDGLEDPIYKESHYSGRLNSIYSRIKELPKGVIKFIYSPFGDFSSLSLKKGFEWIQPYHGIFAVRDNNLLSTIESNRGKAFQEIFASLRVEVTSSTRKDPLYQNSFERYFLTEGYTAYLADALYNGCNVLITPSTDMEGMLNAALVEKLGLGVDLGQIELTPKTAVEKINNFIESNENSKNIRKSLYKTLDERIDELWETV